MWSQAPSWRAAPPPSTCATTCWSSPEASLLSSSATGSCRRCVDMERCQAALCSRGGLAVDTVSNPYTERLLLLWEFRHVTCSQKGQHINTNTLKTALANVQFLTYPECVVSESNQKSSKSLQNNSIKGKQIRQTMVKQSCSI